MRRLFRPSWTAVLVAVLVTSTGCSGLGGSSNNAPVSGSLEKSRIRVGTLELVDSAPLFTAIDREYFKAEGLNVELLTGAKGSANVDNLIGGSLDIGLTSYPPALIPHANRHARQRPVVTSSGPSIMIVDYLPATAVPTGGAVEGPECLETREIHRPPTVTAAIQGPPRWRTPPRTGNPGGRPRPGNPYWSRALSRRPPAPPRLMVLLTGVQPSWPDAGEGP